MNLDLLWREFVERLELPVLPHKLGEIPHEVTANHLQDVLGGEGSRGQKSLFSLDHERLHADIFEELTR